MSNIITFEHYLNGLSRGDVEEFFYETIEDSAGAITSSNMIAALIKVNTLYTVVDDINDMIFGQFVAAERAISSGVNDAEALKALALTVIRPLGDEEFDNEDEEKELEHRQSILNESYAVISKELARYAELRKEYVHGTFNGVFYRINDDSDEEYEEDVSDNTAEENFVNNWYWYSIQKKLAGDDIFKFDDVLMLKMGVVAPALAYDRQLSMIEEARRKREEQINRR